MSWMSKVLIIGGGGYVGSQLVSRLLATNRKVTVLDTFWYGIERFEALKNPNLNLIKADMRDIGKVSDALKGHCHGVSGCPMAGGVN